MSGIDLSAAVEAAARAARNTRGYHAGRLYDVPGDAVEEFTNATVSAALTAAAPLIGEAIAQAIEAERDRILPRAVLLDAARDAYDTAARIAREVTR